MAGKRHFARRHAVQALYQWDLTQQSPEEIEQHFIQDTDMSNVDKEYFHHLIDQVPHHKQELDDNIKPFLDDRGMDMIDPVERAILRIAAYEIQYEPDTPTKVVLDEAVELAKVFGAEHGYKFVNGVLDKLALEQRPTN